MSDNIYLVDIGYNEDTVIYELVPKKVAQLKGYTVQGIEEVLRSFGARSLLVDSSPQATDALRRDGFNVIRGIVPMPKKEQEADNG